MNLPERIKEFIERESLVKRGSRVILGLSGGADSVCLLSIMIRLGYDCHAVHCHFGLRGEESDRDAEFSREIAAKFGAHFTLRRFDVPKISRKSKRSVEMLCRDLRYELFEKLRMECSADVIAVGHHREDNVETMLLNLLRGCGIHGVKAMIPRSGDIIRPLLDTSRADIMQYLADENIPYIVDSSNLKNDYKRNKLRNVILPTIAEYFPDAMTSLSRSVKNLRDCESLYNRLLPERSNSLVGVDSTLLHEWLSPYGFNSDQCRRMLTANPGAQFDSDSHKVTICPGKTYELIALNDCDEMKVPLIEFNHFTIDQLMVMERDHLYLDTDTLPDNADFEVRLWKEGDKMIPFGMSGCRMVSDVMKDCSISASQRRKTWLLTINDEIVWIIGHRRSALYPLTEKTKHITEIFIYNHEDI